MAIGFARSLRIAVLGMLLAVGLAPAARAQSVANGEAIFDAVCSQCHGSSPAININNIVTVGANNPGAILTAWQTFPDMGFLVSILGTADRADVAAYLGTFASAPPPPPTPGVLVNADVVVFQSRAVGTTSDPSLVTLTNLGGKSVSVASIASSNPGEFTIPASTCTALVNPGATCAYFLTFTPAGAGVRNATITITSDGMGSPQSMTAFGTGIASAGQLSSASALTFASQPVGSASAAQSVVVQNIGTAAVLVGAITSNSSEFAVSAGSCSGSLAAGASCQFSATFAPTATGSRGATITIASNGTGNPNTIGATGIGDPPAGPPKAALIEYYHAVFDHYFMTAIADEITKLDNGTFAGWTRTGRQFSVYGSAGANLVPVCRFFSNAFAPKSSHFYTPFASECTTVKKNPDWTFEGEVFDVALPTADGSCAAGTVPVYRVYNNGQGAAPNHRYTTDMAVRQQMLDKGYVPEGLGAVGVIWCSPQ